VHHFVVATAGHVDHGKSALVHALTGTDPDRLPEEKLRGITIQLGFAHLLIPASESRPELQVGIVDVPGHEDFVKNMVAGVGAIDLALLVIAADDGWMPQTEEHLQILIYLGVTRAVIALSKIDLASADGAMVAGTIREKLRGTSFADAAIIKTSTVTGRGLDELRETLGDVLAESPAPADLAKPRLPIDRAFLLRGIGLVVTGTLHGGSLLSGQSITVQPSGKTARIRSVQNHHQMIDAALPGMRTALNLPDLSARVTGSSPGGAVQRGDVVTLPELGDATMVADVILERSSRLIDARSGVGAPLKSGKRVRIHHGSGNFPARLMMESSELRAGERALARLQFELPIFVFAGDRFIVRDWAGQRTVAGGMVLDPQAQQRNFRSSAQQGFLNGCVANPGASGFLHAHIARDGALRRAGLLAQSRFSNAEIAQTIVQLEKQGAVVGAGDLVADAEWWKRLRDTASEAIATWHANHAEQIGMPLNKLRELVEKQTAVPGIFDALVADLTRRGFQQTGASIRQSLHRPALPPRLQQAGQKLRAALNEKPLEPPSRKELTGDIAAQQALRFLIESGEAIEVSAELVVSAEGFGRAKDTVQAFLHTHTSATVSELRAALGTNRRVIVPLLEHFDRLGITQRLGDKRTLRKQG